MPLPVNFEEKVKAAPAIGGAGYPYRISARDLMRDFVHASVEVPPYTDQGFRNGIVEVRGTGDNGHANRRIFAEAFPENPAAGDLMYYNGSEWVSLPAPGGSVMHVLTHNGTAPAWTETEAC